jgi:hypothetical protein
VIGPPTVLIVGAGASVPYELPSGRRLLEDAIGMTRELVRELPPLLGASPEVIQDFLERLRTAECDSIDAMLERHEYDEHIQRAGRGVIAYCLAPYLRRTTLTAPGADWLKFVWNKMAEGASTFQDLRRNRLHIVTFNLDRIIELKMTKAITALYGTAPAAEVTEFVETIVIHLQGAVDHPPVHAPVTAEWMSAAVRGIRVVREPAYDLTTNIVGGLVEAAHVVCCLGFGHHRDNVSRLGFPELTPAKANMKTIYSTAIGLTEGQLPEIQRAYGPGWVFEFGRADESCLEYLTNRDILRA